VTARAVAPVLLILLASPAAFAQKVQIGVLELFHPREITLSAADREAIVVTAGDKVFVLEPGAHTGAARIQASNRGLLLEFGGQLVHAGEIFATGRNKSSASLLLRAPGKVSRKYQGTLDVKAIGGEVVSIVTMDLETAVASVIAAESARDAPLEALKAQAVVTRSYLVAGKGRHRNFDFCDLTHCQFLREPPSPESPAGVAAAETSGLVITFEEKPFAAMFTRSCAGHTRTPAELGISFNNYPYYSVACEACYKSPQRWTCRIPAEEAARLAGKGEAGRLAVNRRLGWSTVRSNNFRVQREGGEVILLGTGEGHGIGLCQRGAKAMADGGASFREIIGHYFPNAALKSVDTPTGFRMDQM
jgi:peptidoglycan hydrolase-like amidase